ncbi:Putative peptidyl-tRNA hydrolase PTRHD1 [Galdieria sulphuraria]|nr:Putative peptidyl-tRNA hydrolase PTRHD1 [Galdieria sulphuraria]
MSMEHLVQYIIVRKDLIADFGWPLGSVIAQGVHAAIAVNWEYRDDPFVQAYCTQESQQMHTVVLETSNEAKLLALAEQLEGAHIKCVVWKEQPENVSTAVAIKPYPKEQVASYLKHLRLCR